MSLQGTVKIFNPLKGFGFITTSDGTDIFMHIKACNATETTGIPQTGDAVTFDMIESSMKPGQMQAENVSGGTGGPAKRGGGEHQGQCKSFNQEKGFGFIIGSDGSDIFFHIKGVTDGSTPQAGDVLSFDAEESRQKPGEVQAQNITGGTGYDPKGKGKGKGKDDGKGWGKDAGKGWDGYGAAKGGWGGDDGWGASPYGKGKDGGKGDGKGGKMAAMMSMMSSMASMWGGDGWGGDSWSGKGGDSWGGKGGGKGW